MGDDRWAVVCDFDGTAVTDDIGDLVAIHFGGYENWRAAEDRYKAGELTFGALLSAIFAPITASPAEIGSWAAQRAAFRPGLERLVNRCREAGQPFVICSAGLDVYIEAVLDKLPSPLRNHVQLRANRALCSPSGLTVEFHGNGTAAGCGRCGFCKRTIVDELRQQGYRVVMCGDGSADRCAAERADLVFARGRLPKYCDEIGLKYTEFETFDDVLAALPR